MKLIYFLHFKLKKLIQSFEKLQFSVISQIYAITSKNQSLI